MGAAVHPPALLRGHLLHERNGGVASKSISAHIIYTADGNALPATQGCDVCSGWHAWRSAKATKGPGTVGQRGLVRTGVGLVRTGISAVGDVASDPGHFWVVDARHSDQQFAFRYYFSESAALTVASNGRQQSPGLPLGREVPLTSFQLGRHPPQQPTRWRKRRRTGEEGTLWGGSVSHKIRAMGRGLVGGWLP